MSDGQKTFGPFFRVRQLRAQLRLAWCRYRLATSDFSSGLGHSAWVLHGLVRAMKPEVCVEIGSASGWSTCHIGLALRENVRGRLFAIDPHMKTDWNDPGPAETLVALRKNLRGCGVERRVEIVQKSSREAARDWKEPIDLLFIDGDHSFEGVKSDWDLFSPFLSPFGVAVFHDAGWDLMGDKRPDMGVPRFLDGLRRGGYPVITLSRDFGVSLVQACVGGRPLV